MSHSIVNSYSEAESIGLTKSCGKIWQSMSGEFYESQSNTNAGNPEQAKDSRIPMVISELSHAARLLQEPRLLTYSSRPEEIKEGIIYESADGSRSLELLRDDFTRTRYGSSNLPKQLQEYERVIPVTCVTKEFIKPNIKSQTYSEVWLTLDKENPQVFQLLKEDGRYLHHYDELTGREKLQEHPELLSHFVEAVSGKKAVHKDTTGLFEWRYRTSFREDRHPLQGQNPFNAE